MLKKIKQSTFLLNIATLASGTALSQGILFTVTPFLTRLYSPEDFGIFALYVSIISILSVIVTLKYEAAIMLPRDDEDAQALLFLSVITSFFISGLMFLFIFFFKDLLLQAFSPKLDFFIWIVPGGILVSGILQSIQAYSIRFKHYKIFSGARVFQSLSVAGIQSGSKIFSWFDMGLIWGNFLGTVVALIIGLFYEIKKNTLHLKKLSGGIIIKNAKEYKEFPIFQSISGLLDILLHNLPVILFSSLYSSEIAGYYSLAQRVLAAPVSLLSGSVRVAYYEKASKMFASGESINKVYIDTTKGLFKTGIIPFLILALFSRQIFVFVFGAEWLTSGIYLQIVALWIFAFFIMTPTLANVYILRLQKFYFVFQLIFIATVVSAFYAGYVFFQSEYFSLLFFSFFSFVFSIFLIYYCYKKTPNAQ